MFLVQGGIQKETTFKKYELTLFTVLQIAFFHLTNVRDIPSNQQTGQVIFSAMCYAIISLLMDISVFRSHAYGLCTSALLL